jgi:hypothetical protein
MPNELKNKFRVYCGPSIVEATAQRLVNGGLSVYLLGTETVYVETKFTAEHVLAVLGPTWRAKDIQELK